jgi:broad specificity phosphatase PhoE
MKKIILVRHSETLWSLNGRHTGLTDIPLTEQGEREAKELKERLKKLPFQKVFTSPLKRAVETCKLSGLFDHAVIDPDLVEWNYGDYEGLTHAEIISKNPSWNIFTQGAPGGESVEDVCARADRVLKRLSAFKETCILFSSAHFLRLLATRWLHLPPKDGELFALSPSSISLLGYERENHVILSWNQS